MQLKAKISTLAFSLLLSGCYVNVLPGNNTPAEIQPAPTPAQIVPAVQPILPGQSANPQIVPTPAKLGPIQPTPAKLGPIQPQPAKIAPAILPGQTQHLLPGRPTPAPVKINPMARCKILAEKLKDKKKDPVK